MKRAACLLWMLPLAACEEAPADSRWLEVEKGLADGLDAAKKRSAAEALPAVRRALDSLEALVREEWTALLTIAPKGWVFFPPNIQISTARASNGETVIEVKGSLNGRREAGGTIVNAFLSSSPLHMDSQREMYEDADRVAAMKRTMDIEVESRDGWLIVRKLSKMRSEAIFIGEDTLLTITIAREDKALLAEAVGWIDLALAKRLDAGAGKSQAR